MTTYTPVTLRYPQQREFHGVTLRPGVTPVLTSEWERVIREARALSERRGHASPLEQAIADGVVDVGEVYERGDLRDLN